VEGLKQLEGQVCTEEAEAGRLLAAAQCGQVEQGSDTTGSIPVQLCDAATATTVRAELPGVERAAINVE